MIEEPIDFTLDFAGVNIEIQRTPAFSIKIFPGFDFDFLGNGRSSTGAAERQSFSFQGATKTIAPLDLVVGEFFRISDTIATYLFEINTNPIPDITGWSRIFADFKGTLSFNQTIADPVPGTPVNFFNIVPDLSARDLIQSDKVIYVLVEDATDDPTVDLSSASYLYNPLTNSWTKVSESESMDDEFSWSTTNW